MSRRQRFCASIPSLKTTAGVAIREPEPLVRWVRSRTVAKLDSLGLVVQDRFQNHKKGQKSAWVVKKYGLRLIPELYEYLNPVPFEAAAQMEKDLAEDLRADGYIVAGGT